jgi:hypothetical protein
MVNLAPGFTNFVNLNCVNLDRLTIFFFRSGAVFGESGAAGAVANKSSINVIHLGLLYLLWCFSAET